MGFQAVAFGVYVLWLVGGLERKWGEMVAGIAVGISLISFPNLSDDIFRFFWDGVLTINHISPFDHLPVEVYSHLKPADQVWLWSLNSPYYYSIYPSFNQLLFLVGAALGDSFEGFALVYSLLFLLPFFGIAWAWKKNLVLRQLPSSLFFLNPFVIVEFWGNLHAEIWVVWFGLLAWNAYIDKKEGTAFAWICLSIATKLIPAICIPAFALKYYRSPKFWLIGATGLAFLLIPLVGHDRTQHFLESFNLYVQTFEFQAYFYPLFKAIGTAYLGYNPIKILGPILSISSATLILLLTAIHFKKGLSTSLFVLLFAAYYLLTPIFHPWYYLYFLALGIAKKEAGLVLYSACLPLSYYAYCEPGFSWEVWGVQIGFGLVLWFYRKGLNSLLFHNGPRELVKFES